VPCVAPAWSPVILLPRGLRARLTEAQFDCVLAHERHHVARRDPAWALLVALLRVPLAIHPVTRRLLADLSLAREEAVDALIAHEDATTYASALVEVAAQASVGSGFPDAVFMGAHALSRRVDLLMNPRPLRSARLTPVLVAALLLGALSISASPAKAAEPEFTTDAVVLSPMAPISVRVGTDTVLSFPGVIHSQIGDEKLADVCTLTEGRIHVNGLALGSTTLTIWTEKGNVTYPIWIDL
jgi:BlaR1 peptidase M56/Pilus formation protein N terminal region